MTEKLFKWIIVSIGSILLIAGTINLLFGASFFAVALYKGYSEGFSLFLIEMSIFFGSLLLGELADILTIRSDKDMYARTPHMFSVLLRGTWLGIMSLLLYITLSSEDMPRNVYAIGLTVSIAGLLYNSCSLIFHAAFCFKKVRTRVAEMSKEDAGMAVPAS